MRGGAPPPKRRRLSGEAAAEREWYPSLRAPSGGGAGAVACAEGGGAAAHGWLGPRGGLAEAYACAPDASGALWRCEPPGGADDAAPLSLHAPHAHHAAPPYATPLRFAGAADLAPHVDAAVAPDAAACAAYAARLPPPADVPWPWSVAAPAPSPPPQPAPAVALVAPPALAHARAHASPPPPRRAHRAPPAPLAWAPLADASPTASQRLLASPPRARPWLDETAPPQQAEAAAPRAHAAAPLPPAPPAPPAFVSPAAAAQPSGGVAASAAAAAASAVSVPPRCVVPDTLGGWDDTQSVPESAAAADAGADVRGRPSAVSSEDAAAAPVALLRRFEDVAPRGAAADLASPTFPGESLLASPPPRAYYGRSSDTVIPETCADDAVIPESPPFPFPLQPPAAPSAADAPAAADAAAPAAVPPPPALPAPPLVADIFALDMVDAAQAAPAAAAPPPPPLSGMGGLFSYDVRTSPLRGAGGSGAAASALLPAWSHGGGGGGGGGGGTLPRTVSAPLFSAVGIVTASGVPLQAMPGAQQQQQQQQQPQGLSPLRRGASSGLSPPPRGTPVIRVYSDSQEAPLRAPPPAPRAADALRGVLADENAPQPPPPAAPPAAPAGGSSSLFSTGSGRALTVSAATLARGALIFGGATASAAAAAVPAAPPPPPPAVAAPAPARAASGFSTAGSGRALTVSAATLAAARASMFADLLPPSDAAAAPAPQQAPPPAASGGGFALATGARMAPPSAATSARAVGLVGEAAAGGSSAAAAPTPFASPGFLPPGGPARTPVAVTPAPALQAPGERGRARFNAPKAITPSPLAPHNGARGGAGVTPGTALRSGGERRKSGGGARHVAVSSPFCAAPPLPPMPPPPAGPLHALHAPLRAAGARLPLRAFFREAVPFAGCIAAPCERVSAWPPGVPPDAAAVTAANAGTVTLPMPGPMGDLTPALAHWALIARHGANARLATPEWVANHWRFIVWKLACYERAFPAAFPGGAAAPERALCADRVMDQLRLRYEREHNRAERPVLRRVFEGDTPAGVPMCLVVCGMRAVAAPKPAAAAAQAQHESGGAAAAGDGAGGSDAGGPLSFELELTDGWYPIRASLDAMLTDMVRKGKLCVGDKLMIASATKVGSDAPAPPLEGYASTSLGLGVNGCRRAPWDMRLGRAKAAPMLPLRLVRPGGGAVPMCAVTISRVYPLVYMQRTIIENADGSETTVNTMRNAAAEAAAAAAHDVAAEACRDAAAATAVETAQRERDARRRTSARPTSRADDEPPADAAAAAQLQRAAEADSAAVTAAVNFAVQAALEEAKLTPRDVMPLLKLRVAGLAPPGCPGGPGEAVIAVWRPDESALATLVEGATFVVTNLGAPGLVGGPQPAQAGQNTANAAPPKPGVGREGGVLELTTHRSTWLRATPGHGALRGLATGYAPRRCAPLCALGAMTPAAAAQAAHDDALGCGATDAAAAEVAAAAFAAISALPAAVVENAPFDAVGILLHAAPPQPLGLRGARQYAFFVDASLVAAASAASPRPGGGVDAADVDLVAVQLRCAHERGFVPLPTEATPGALCPVMALRHVTFSRRDAANRVRCCDAPETAELGPPPKPAAVAAAAAAGTAASPAAVLAGALAQAALDAAQWAQDAAPLLAALRERAMLLTQSSDTWQRGPEAGPLPRRAAADAAPIWFPPAQPPRAQQPAFALPLSQQGRPGGNDRHSIASDCADWEASELRQLDAAMAAAGALGAPPAGGSRSMVAVGRTVLCPPEPTLGLGDTQVLEATLVVGGSEGDALPPRARAASGDGMAAREAARAMEEAAW